MRVAVPIGADGLLADDFSGAGQFALYDVDDGTRAVSYVGREAVAHPGCGRSAGALKEKGVEVVLGHSLSDNAVAHLLEVKILAITEAPILSADALVAHLVSGTLQARPPRVVEAAMQSCGGGGCGNCNGGGHAHSHETQACENDHCTDHPHQG